MFRNSHADRATTRVQQALGDLTRRVEDERVAARCCRFQKPELNVVDSRVLSDFRQIAAHQREVVAFIETTDRADSLHRGFVSDPAAQRIARIRRINDDAAAAYDLRSLS